MSAVDTLYYKPISRAPQATQNIYTPPVVSTTAVNRIITASTTPLLLVSLQSSFYSSSSGVPTTAELCIIDPAGGQWFTLDKASINDTSTSAITNRVLSWEAPSGWGLVVPAGYSIAVRTVGGLVYTTHNIATYQP